MSSFDKEGSSTISYEPFQSAQRPPDHPYPLEDELDSSDDESSEEFAANEGVLSKTTLQNSLELPEGRDTKSSRAPIESEDYSPSDVDIPGHDSFQSRPNRYRGSASTWRDWTAPERDLAASLDQLTAKDLSVHLYNAFMLKKRVDTDRRQQQLQDLNADELGDSTGWMPPKVWTAWPLPPGEVPREKEGKCWEAEGGLERQPSVEKGRSSEKLRELLIAEVLRRARLRFDQREPKDPSAEGAHSQQASQIKEPARAPKHENNKHRSKNLKPVIMADDERASEILRPTVSRILAKLDGLLLGLHHARSSYSAIDDFASESQDQVAESSRKQTRSALPPNQSAAVASARSVDSDISERSKSKKRMRSESRSQCSRIRSIRTRRRRLGLRDWSDVLGVASMTGWDPNVIDRAAARCASLFREGVTFRTLQEGRPAFQEQSYISDKAAKPSRSVHETRSMADETERREVDMFGGVHIDGYLRPVEGKKSWKYSNTSSVSRSKSRRPVGKSSRNKYTS